MDDGNHLPDTASWPRRLLAAIPPMADAVWVGILLFTILMCGVTLGLTLRFPRPSAPTPTLQDQLHRLEQRVRALEER
jgi:hypothetical protein